MSTTWSTRASCRSDARARLSLVRALLLTDVVDSTKLAATLGDAAMARLWAAHDRAARDLLREWRGREIDKSDGMLLLFETAADAAGYALAYHYALAGLEVPVKARAGLHVGPVAPPADSANVYRVVRHGYVWLPARQIPHKIPAERDVFVGRHEPLRDLAVRLQAGARLVSVIGIGGTGKTRFVTRFAWTSLGDFPGGVWFCDLSAARDVDGIAHAVADSLDVALGKDDPVAELGNAIAGRGKCLVILDNFEQVSRHAEETLGQWLDRAAAATFVVTTREVLGLPGEQTLALPPLPPADAVALFERRATQAS